MFQDSSSGLLGSLSDSVACTKSVTGLLHAHILWSQPNRCHSGHANEKFKTILKSITLSLAMSCLSIVDCSSRLGIFAQTALVSQDCQPWALLLKVLLTCWSGVGR